MDSVRGEGQHQASGKGLLALYLSSRAPWSHQWHQSSRSGWRRCAQRPASPASPEPSRPCQPLSHRSAGSPSHEPSSAAAGAASSALHSALGLNAAPCPIDMNTEAGLCHIPLQSSSTPLSTTLSTHFMTVSSLGHHACISGTSWT